MSVYNPNWTNPFRKKILLIFSFTNFEKIYSSINWAKEQWWFVKCLLRKILIKMSITIFIENEDGHSLYCLNWGSSVWLIEFYRNVNTIYNTEESRRYIEKYLFILILTDYYYCFDIYNLIQFNLTRHSHIRLNCWV